MTTPPPLDLWMWALSWHPLPAPPEVAETGYPWAEQGDLPHAHFIRDRGEWILYIPTEELTRLYGEHDRSDRILDLIEAEEAAQAAHLVVSIRHKKRHRIPPKYHQSERRYWRCVTARLVHLYHQERPHPQLQALRVHLKGRRLLDEDAMRRVVTLSACLPDRWRLALLVCAANARLDAGPIAFPLRSASIAPVWLALGWSGLGEHGGGGERPTPTQTTTRG